jgi:tRNA threonylcarbamoyl adenosine modification protein YjeE
MACDSYMVQMTLDGMQATERLAHILASSLHKGDFIALAGALGAGKTTLARCIVQTLVPGEEVPSPTFTLVQAYDAPGFRIAHADLYRLRSEREIVELGFDEALEAGVLIVEWPDRMGGLMPADRLDIILEVDDGAEERRTKIIGRGAWAARLRGLHRTRHLS